MHIGEIGLPTAGRTIPQRDRCAGIGMGRGPAAGGEFVEILAGIAPSCRNWRDQAASTSRPGRRGGHGAEQAATTAAPESRRETRECIMGIILEDRNQKADDRPVSFVEVQARFRRTADARYDESSAMPRSPVPSTPAQSTPDIWLKQLFGRPDGRGMNPPPQLGQTPPSTSVAQASQNVHSNEQIIAPAEFGRQVLIAAFAIRAHRQHGCPPFGHSTACYTSLIGKMAS